MSANAIKGVTTKSTYSLRQKIGLFLSVPIFAVILLLPGPAGLSPAAHRTLAVAVLMAWLWVTEAIPIPATALLPLVLFPLMGILNYKAVAPNYADNVIFLFMGGFFLAMTMQKWNLHKRLALHIVHAIGTSPRRIILGFMIATAFLSLWISNTSTALMMYPIALAVLLHFTDAREADDLDEAERQNANIQKALLLGIAYAANVGGIGTLIGTPPNVIFAGMVNSLYPSAPPVAFFQWMLIGIPIVVIFIPIIWYFLTGLIFPISIKQLSSGREYILEELKALGKITRAERVTLWVFVVTALALVFRKNIELGLFTIPGWSNLLGVSGQIDDTTVLMSASLVLFATPINLKKKEFLLDWKWAAKIPWGILLLFGGGIALAKGFQTSGLAEWFGTRLSILSRVPIVVMILLVCLMLTFLTEMTSNTAVTTIFMPILASTALAMHSHPFLLMLPAAISASCAFMLPVATAPNAIVFGSGYVRIADMAKAGIFLNIVGALLITTMVYLLAIPIFKITVTGIPEWVK